MEFNRNGVILSDFDFSAALAASFNKSLHWTAFPLRFKAASELGRYCDTKSH